MITLGIDQSFTGTGIAVFSGETLVFHTQISTKQSDGCKLVRQRRIENGIIHILQQLQKKSPEIVIVIEGLAYGAFGKSKVDLSKLLGGILSRLMQINFPLDRIKEVPPTAWKKMLVGVGGARKQEVIETINKKFNQQFKMKHNNICDAIGLAYYYVKSPKDVKNAGQD